jgi:hypothetical protein
MSWLGELDLIRFFEFYLALMLLLGTTLRLRQYATVLGLLRAMPGRWPRLLRLLRENYGAFLSRASVLPGGLAIGLMLTHTLANRLVWPQANLKLADLFQLWPAVPLVLLPWAAMTALDVYGLFRVGRIDKAQVEKHLDEAEYWLNSWASPVVRVFTFGYVDPRRIVLTEVQKALVWLNSLLNSTLWWITLQTGLRIAYGLSIWLTYAWMANFGPTPG